VALRLKRNGITRVRPLYGGLNGWMQQQFPVEKLVVEPSERGGGGSLPWLRSSPLTPEGQSREARAKQE